MKKLEALVVTEDKAVLKEIQQLFKERDIEVITSENWDQPEVGQGNFSYYLLDESVIETIDSVKIPPSSVLVGLIRERSFDLVRKWMQHGAHDVIVVPDEIKNLDVILQKNVHLLKSDEVAATNEEVIGGGAGRVRAFYSAKGGSGKTLLAAMVAQSLQIQCGQRVMLIDFNSQFGGLEVIFGLDPKRSYLDLLPVIQELSISHIHNVATTEEETGISVLLSPANPEQAEMVTDELVTRVIRTCKAHFDQIILDLPSALNTVSFTALNEAHDIYYVLTPDSLSVRSLKNALALFRRFQIGNRGNLSLILNRKNNKSELAEKDIAHLVDLPIAGSVRADFFGIQPLLNMGRPFYSKKSDKGSSKVAQDVRSIVQKVLANGV